MPNINLIAARREEKKKVERLSRQLFMGFVGTVGILVIVILYISARQLTAHNDLSVAEKDWATVKPKLARIEELKKAKDTLDPRVDTLQEAKTATMRWRAVMQSISQAIPSEAWLSNMQTVGSGSDMIVKLSGVASSQTVVGETMTRIGAQPIFDGVELSVTQLVPQGPTETIKRYSFDIGAHLKAPVDPDKPDPKDPSKKDTTQKADAGSTTNGGNKNG